MGSNLFSYETLVHAVAGACGSVAAMGLTTPLDTVRTRLLLDKRFAEQGTLNVLLQLVKKEGILTLYRGVATSLECVAVSNFVYFYAFHGLKNMSVTNSKQQSVYKDLLFACLSGAINVLLTNPLWVVNMRIKLQGTQQAVESEQRPTNYKGLQDGLVKLASSDGLGALWNGTVASLVLVSNPAIKFTVYEYLKRRFGGRFGRAQLEPTRAFLLGVLASLVATSITYPVQVVQAKARHSQKMAGLKKDPSFLHLTIYLLRNFGPGYLYKGLDAKLLQSMVTAGFMFLSYEQIAAFIFHLFGLRKLKST